MSSEKFSRIQELGATRKMAEEALARLFLVNGSLGALQSSIVFQPGGTPGGNVYATAAGVATALAGVNGAAIVYVDNTFAPCVIPPGVIWNFEGYGQIWGIQGVPPTLTINDTAQIQGLAAAENVVLVAESQTVPSFSFNYSKIPYLWLKRTATLKTDATATIAPIQIPAFPGTFGLGLAEGSTFVNATPAVPLVTVGTGGRMIFFVFQSLSIAGTSTAVSGGAGTLEWVGDATAFPPPTFPDFTGTFLVVAPLESAPGVRYAPGNSANWVAPAPTTVQVALDRIANNTGNVHPIP